MAAAAVRPVFSANYNRKQAMDQEQHKELQNTLQFDCNMRFCTAYYFYKRNSSRCAAAGTAAAHLCHMCAPAHQASQGQTCCYYC